MNFYEVEVRIHDLMTEARDRATRYHALHAAAPARPPRHARAALRRLLQAFGRPGTKRWTHRMVEPPVVNSPR